MPNSPCRRPGACGPTLLACLLGAGLPVAQAAVFDSSFMQPFGGGSAGPNLDLEAIAHNAQIPPGLHLVTIRLNQSFYERRELRFDDAGNGEVRACLSPAMLDAMGVKLAAFIDQRELETLDCVDLQQVVEGALVTFDPAYLALDISVPQVALRRDAAGYVAPEEWDAGINAGLLNYQFTGSQGHTAGQGDHNQFSLYLNGGLNLVGWRLRSNGSYSQDQKGQRQWQRSATYAQTDLPGSLGTFTFGESFTAGDVFDSLPFRGVQVASDIGMLPDSMQGYAPVIRGVAETRARVEVRHNGYSLYSTFVPPGPFEINDLNASSGSGDLEVIITEADGRERSFTQPYATLGNLLRENTWRYGLTVGEYNAADENGNRPGLAQATLAYGLPYDYTLSGGLLGNDFYRATQLGLGKNLGSLGAISLDVTQARSEGRDGRTDQGRSYGIRYGKAFASGTSVRFAGYRYSTEGYRDFSEAVWQHQGDNFNRMTKRSRVQASINQNFGNTSLYLNLSQQDYWNTSRRERQLQLGVNTVHRGVSYGLYASKSLVDSFGQSSLISFNVSIPLGGGSSGTLALSRNNDGSYDQRAGYRGRSGHLNYALDANHAERSGGSGSASLSYLAPFAQLGAGVSAGERYQQVNVSASGSLLAHSGGIALGQTLGETLGLVHVADTPGVGLGNAPGTRTDSSGYALIPYLTPYRKNRVSLDTSGLDHSTEIENGVTNVVPRRGAVVKAEFAAQRVEKVLLNLRLEDGGLPPFGAQVVDGAQRMVGVVGPGGQALLAFEGGVEALTVRWGASASQQCRALLALAGEAPEQGYRQVQSVCRQAEVALVEHHAAGRG
ncbi:fimbrial biogenesis outer membrane usher protein [Pseudomonas sichuanensis]|uniref:fimbria/pilus outer membrane usher protein n=1 Tax=Pseudomonas sichuanensis TaxID=2213015 RepID=UPI00244BF2DB|nr:fimbrial biogenesis outer membrane usher protein [Pseudomonas sichuanensis]MDH0729989.1 fimbrial biogenesis outer membrane usher protein [Pseudomonas sichuanensis]MDH1584543.1 fimbrial biogenesis outer membrane usher protein [Pseudomonas sichuanensis]MDH1593671.1 fimbrial biogenesis outer membrane usher protein [Pseudomonas sichuanensis]MDH1600206.1 fimbrial biogenesis outer membrane usher protein [Pseudomonas sichuanensis]